MLDRLDLGVERGRVYALLGRNGVGKTTFLRILVGLLRADSGSCSVLGLDPRTRSTEIKSKTGFVSEGLEFYSWMRVSELLDFAGRFHSEWDTSYVESLVKKLDVPVRSKVEALSRGVRGKLALILALGHHPELLLLDEPLAGLDSVVRRQFLTETVEILTSQKCTILFVTHLIDEVEKIADAVGILHGGRLIESGAVDRLKGRYSHLRASFPQCPPAEVNLLGRAVTRLGNDVSLVVENPSHRIEERLRGLGAHQVETTGLGLDELFCVLTDGPE